MALNRLLALQRHNKHIPSFCREGAGRNPGGFDLGNIMEEHFVSMANKLRNTAVRCAVSIALVLILTMSMLIGISATCTGGMAVAEDYVVYSIGTTLVPDDFNPFEMTTGISYAVSYLMHEFLITTGPVAMEPYPQLASSWESSEDSLVWTFHLAHDAYWHDDVPVTSADVVFTLELMMENPEECALWSNEMAYIVDASAPDDYTVIVTLSSPRSDVEGGLVPILPEHLWSNVDPSEISSVDLWDSSIFPDGPVGSGPFILEEFQRTEGLIIMKAWEKYHMGKVNIDELRIVIYTQPDAMVTALETGEIDLAMGVPPTAWTPLIDLSGIEGQASSSIDLTEFGINCAPADIRFSVDEQGTPNFPQASDNLETLNLAVRQAMAMAINQTYLVENVMLGLATEGSSLVPPATPYWHWYVPEDEKWSHNLEEAKQLLEDAGYTDTNYDGIRENESSGEELDFVFYYISSTDVDKNAAIQISLWLEEIGIKAEPQGVMEGTLYNYWFNMAYDLFIWNWQPGADPTFILSVLTTGEIPEDSKDKTAWSDAFYSNPEYDQLFVEQQQALSMSARQLIVHEMQRIVYRDSPYVILWYPSGLDAYRTDEFYNFPDMTAMAGIAPDNFWFYYEILPVGVYPPTNVYAGDDQNAFIGDTVSFTGSAEDLNDPLSSLNWTWVFVDPDSAETTKYERTVSYTLTKIGVIEVTLTVTDPIGLSASDSLIITVSEAPTDSGSIEGFVKEDAGQPIVGATVVIESEDRQSSTDATGHYSFTLAPGAYTLNVSAGGYENASGGTTVETLAISWLNFTLTATAGSMSVNVTDAANGNPVDGAEITVSSGSFTKTVYTNDQGHYELVGLEPGSYAIQVSADVYEDNSTTAEVLAGETAKVSVELVPSEDTDGGAGTNTVALAAGIGVAAAVAAVAMALILKKRGRPKGPSSGEDAIPPDEQDHS